LEAPQRNWDMRSTLGAVKVFGASSLFIHPYFGFMEYFRHSWSISVEELFYLIAPLPIYFAITLTRTKKLFSWNLFFIFLASFGIIAFVTYQRIAEFSAAPGVVPLQLPHLRVDGLFFGFCAGVASYAFSKPLKKFGSVFSILSMGGLAALLLVSLDIYLDGFDQHRYRSLMHSIANHQQNRRETLLDSHSGNSLVWDLRLALRIFSGDYHPSLASKSVSSI
jgi:peptidoglycan/LPS O-acetylase OafA/YrhL